MECGSKEARKSKRREFHPRVKFDSAVLSNEEERLSIIVQIHCTYSSHNAIFYTGLCKYSS